MRLKIIDGVPKPTKKLSFKYSGFNIINCSMMIGFNKKFCCVKYNNNQIVKNVIAP
jgi:hypothetical protein